jgi:hypothetical protein
MGSDSSSLAVGDVEQSSFSSLFGDSAVSSVPRCVLENIIGIKCQCKLVNWIGTRVWGSAAMSA